MTIDNWQLAIDNFLMRFSWRGWGQGKRIKKLGFIGVSGIFFSVLFAKSCKKYQKKPRQKTRSHFARQFSPYGRKLTQQNVSLKQGFGEKGAPTAQFVLSGTVFCIAEYSINTDFLMRFSWRGWGCVRDGSGRPAAPKGCGAGANSPTAAHKGGGHAQKK